MDLAVVGVVTCGVAGRTIIPQRRDRALLAVLALDRQRVWSVDELADAIWRGHPAATAAKLVRNRVSHLRGAIGDALITSIASGYRLGDDVALDIDALLSADESHGPSARGRPFVDVEDWAPAWPAIARVTELLFAADENAVAAMLRTADTDVVARAAALVAAEPLRERRWVLLVQALHTAGRRRGALDAAARARRAFAEVGLTSPIELDTAERAVLADLTDASGRTPVTVVATRPSLIGRTGDIDEIESLLAPGRIVTLTGPGGVGKTTLAFEVASRAAHRFADGVWICDLAVATQGDDVAAAVAAAAHLRPDGGIATPSSVAAALGLQACLVVLDNGEHVIDAVAALGAALASLPKTAVLVTSREAIGRSAEHVHVVHPLDLDDAVDLFVLRRRAAGVPATVDGEFALVREICEQLDGLPLAVELAASRSATMSLADLAERLDERLRLLRADHAPNSRHRSLEATVDWSYSLLGSCERVVFDRLSVLTGGFTLAAAESICADDTVTRAEVTDAVVSLVAKSMVVTDGSGRYGLLETLRQFGAQRLRAADMRRQFALAHAAYYASFAALAHTGLQGADAARWCDAVDIEWANLRAAVVWSAAHDQCDHAVTIATRMLWVALYHDKAEPYTWVDTLSARPDLTGHPDWPGVLAGSAWAAFERGNIERASVLADAAIAAEGEGRENTDCFAELTLQSVAYLQGRFDDAERWMRRAETRARRSQEPVLEAAAATVGCSILALGRGDPALAIAHAQAAGRLARSVGNATVTAWALVWEAEARFAEGDSSALAVAQAAASLARTVNAWLPQSSAERVMARHYLATGQTTEATRLVHSCLRTMRRRGSALFVAMYVGFAVPLLTEAGKHDVAARMLGVFGCTPPAQYTTARPVTEEWRRALAARLAPDAMAALLAEGAAMPLETAAALAEGELANILAVDARATNDV